MTRKKKKILVVTGTRAEYGLLYPVIRAIQQSPSLELRLLVTGIHTQKNYGHTIDLIKKDKLPIACAVPIDDKDTMLEAFRKELKGIEEYCAKETPDMMLVSGDRNEPFAAAIVSGHLRIPLAHLSGGDTTGYVVDEPMRHSISKFAHIHFPLSALSAHRLEKMGEEKWRIHMSGSTAFDGLGTKDFQSRASLARVFKLDPTRPWILFIQHPTSLDSTPLTKQISSSLKALKNIEAEKIIVYPNSDTGADVIVEAIEQIRGTPHFTIAKSLPRLTFLSFLKEAGVLVGNSSAGIVEAGRFHTPVVDIGKRQSGRECGKNVIHVLYEVGHIERAIRRALSPAFKRICARAQHPYGSGHASAKIVRVLEKLKLDEKLMQKNIPMK